MRAHSHRRTHTCKHTNKCIAEKNRGNGTAMTRDSEKDSCMDTHFTAHTDILLRKRARAQSHANMHSDWSVRAARINELAAPRDAFYVWRDQTCFYILKVKIVFFKVNFSQEFCSDFFCTCGPFYGGPLLTANQSIGQYIAELLVRPAYPRKS